MDREASSAGLGAPGDHDPYSTTGLMSGRARAGGPGCDDDEDANLCWEITRVLLIGETNLFVNVCAGDNYSVIKGFDTD